MTEQAGHISRKPGSLLAITLVLVSSLLYVLGYGLSKALVDTYALAPLEITFLRCALVLSTCCMATVWRGRALTWRRILRPARAWQQRAAAAAVVASIFLSVLAFGALPMTQASALSFTAPLLLTALAGAVLRERVSFNRWLAAGAGFAGMLLIIQPGAQSLSIGVAAAMGSALAYATYQVLVRRLREVANSLDSVIQVALAGVVLLLIPTIAYWRPVSLRAFVILAAATAVQTGGLVCIVAGLRRGEASRLAPWQFSGLVWAIGLDALMFATQPTLAASCGCLLILAGGVLAQADGLTGRWIARTGRRVPP